MSSDAPGVWLLRQTWSPTLFVHWEVEPDTVRGLLPPALRLDTWQERAFVSLVVVNITGARPRAMPPVPGTHAYQQLNLRTYVTHEGGPGLYFFGAYLSKALPAIAQSLGAGIRSRRVKLRFERHGANVSLRVEPSGVSREGLSLDAVVDGEPRYARAGSLEAWLHERYGAYSRRGRAYLRTDVRHRPWLLARAHVDELSGGLDGAPIPLREPTLVCVGAQANVHLLRPRRVRGVEERRERAAPFRAAGHPA